MRVTCSVSHVDLAGESSTGEPIVIKGVSVECGVCGHTTESYGTSDASVRRCMVLLREECPMGQRNFYVDEDE